MPKEKFSLTQRWNELKTAAKTSRRLLGLLWSVDRTIFIGSVSMAIVPAVTPFVNAYIYKLVINLVVAAANGGSFDYHYFLILIGFRFLVYLAQSLANVAQDSFEQLLWIRFPAAFYQIVLGKISSLDLEYFENSAFKDKLQKLRDNYHFRPINMLVFCFSGFQGVVTLAVALALIIRLDWILGVILFLSCVPAFFNQLTNAKRIWGIWDSKSEYRKKAGYVSDLLQNEYDVKEIRMFGIAPHFLGELKVLFLDFINENVGAVKSQFGVMGALTTLTTILSVGIEAYVIMLAARGAITIGDITYYTAILLGFIGSTAAFFRNTSNIFNYSLYVKEIFDIIDTEPRIVTPVNAVKPSFDKPPRIEFRNVTFSYPGSSRKIYDNFSLTVESGERIAFVGENGAGKTTFVKLLARFYDVDKGEILIDGINIKELDLTHWYGALGVLFQDFVRYDYPVQENIHFGNIAASGKISDIRAAAELSGADEFIKHLDHSYKQMLGKTFDNGTDLSTGQWQKLALARAFFRNAPVLILDEPTAAIDAKAESEIFEKVESLSKGKTTLIISHRFSTVKSADVICVIDKGKIVEQGSHRELMKKKGIYAKLFNLQAKAYRDDEMLEDS